MSSLPVGNRPPTIKPDDLVRTPSGETGIVESLNSDGSRNVRTRQGELVTLKPAHLYLVRAAPIRPWPSRKP